MKKVLLCLFSFLFIGTALTGSVFLLAGCNSSYSQEENNKEDGENETGNNEEINDGSENEDDKPNDDVEGQSAFTINLTVYTMNHNDGYVYGTERFLRSNDDYGGNVRIWLTPTNGTEVKTEATIRSGTTSIKLDDGNWWANAGAHIRVSNPSGNFAYHQGNQWNEMYYCEKINCCAKI